MTAEIYIKDMRLHAYHGVMPQERIVGNDYVINVRVTYPIETASQSDDVNDTLNYAMLADLIKNEMAQPSQLLEHLVTRMASAILAHFIAVQSVCVDIMKVAPPMPVDAAGAGVCVTMTR